MPPQLHLHPDRLRAHAATAAGLSEDLGAVRAGSDVSRGGPRVEWLVTVVLHAVGELAELSAVLAGVAAAAEAADAQVARSLGRGQGGW